tara:strand:- start:320 stop:688 length:369 start_codon:yes stop_codon:yes gene_type:complete
MEGSVKCGAKFKDNAYVIFLYKKPNAVGGLNMTKEKMRAEIADYKYMRDAGLPLPEIYSDVFDCKVNGTKTFGFLVEVVHTSMADPYVLKFRCSNDSYKSHHSMLSRTQVQTSGTQDDIQIH